MFTQHQILIMEQEFTRHRYVSVEKRFELASKLNITERQVQTWFRNRRAKWREEARDELETALMDRRRRFSSSTSQESSRPTELN